MEDKQFEYADLVVNCSCGNSMVLENNIQQGLQIILPTQENSGFALACDKCNTTLTLEMIEAKNPPIKEEENNEQDKLSEGIEEEGTKEQTV